MCENSLWENILEDFRGYRSRHRKEEGLIQKSMHFYPITQINKYRASTSIHLK